jgi:hypothetical protein
MVGRTPWSARVPQDPLLSQRADEERGTGNSGKLSHNPTDPSFIICKVSSETEQAVRFRFPVSWSTLVDASALAPRASQAHVVALPHQAPADSSVQWAMVVPKLAPAAAAPHLLPAVESEFPPTFAAPKYVIPKFEVSSDSSSLAVKFLLSVSVTLLLVPGWRNTGSPGARAVEIESGMRESGWARESAGQARQLVLYRASLPATDYRLDFTWRPDPQGVTCVFRAKDSNNYGAVRIKHVGPESSRAILVERFDVLRGIEKSRVQRALTLPGDGATLQAAINIAGPVFRLYLEGALVSQWTDSRLTSGGLGFLEEGSRPVKVQSVRISFPGRR